MQENDAQNVMEQEELDGSQERLGDACLHYVTPCLSRVKLSTHWAIQVLAH